MRRLVRRLVRRATRLLGPNMAQASLFCMVSGRAAASAADRSPTSTRSSGLIRPLLIGKPPARVMASRIGDRPSVLQKDEGGGGVGRKFIEYVPRLLLREDVYAFRGRLRAQLGTRLHALFAAGAEAHESADERTELRRFLVRQVADLQHGDVAFSVLVDSE